MTPSGQSTQVFVNFPESGVYNVVYVSNIFNCHLFFANTEVNTSRSGSDTGHSFVSSTQQWRQGGREKESLCFEHCQTPNGFCLQQNQNPESHRSK